MTDVNLHLNCFMAYDIRGRIPDEFNEDLAYKIGRAYATFLAPSKVCIGRDVRLSSEAVSQAVVRSLRDQGCDVIDIGLCPTEEIYFATSHLKLDGGIVVTASHNPLDYNGMKLVREQSKPISGDTGLKDIEKIVIEDAYNDKAARKGALESVSTRDAYVEHLLSYVRPERWKSLRVVMNCGNGCAGPILERLEARLPIEFIKIYPEPDGRFPNGIPNPLLPENRGVTAQNVISHKADLGIAWDGDSDRCFFFDENGAFIEGYYLVGFFAQMFLRNHPGSRIIHDPRLVWNTVEMVKASGGYPVVNKAGHAFMKERMRAEDAIYGGEMSAHHFFRHFAYCDSGMIPWLLLIEILSMEERPLSELIQARIDKFPVSGEINRTVRDGHAVLQSIEAHYKGKELASDHVDGLSMEFDEWRFNLRPSNTEPVIRLNLETRADKNLLKAKKDELIKLIGSIE